MNGELNLTQSSMEKVNDFLQSADGRGLLTSVIDLPSGANTDRTVLNVINTENGLQVIAKEQIVSDLPVTINGEQRIIKYSVENPSFLIYNKDGKMTAIMGTTTLPDGSGVKQVGTLITDQNGKNAILLFNNNKISFANESPGLFNSIASFFGFSSGSELVIESGMALAVDDYKIGNKTEYRLAQQSSGGTSGESAGVNHITLIGDKEGNVYVQKV
jgi:hypothetical protein